MPADPQNVSSRSHHGRGSRGHRPSPTPAGPDLLLRLVDLGLASVVFVVPFILGGNTPLARLLFLLIAGGTALVWCVRQMLRSEATWTWSRVEWLLVLGGVLAVAQITPLPDGWLAKVSPQLAQTLPLWTNSGEDATGRLGAWNTISLAPGHTRRGLCMFLAYALLFNVTVQRIGQVEDVERLLRWIAVAAVVMAAFGLAQYFATNGKFYWVYDHPQGTTRDHIKGPFPNRNHFAHFMALAVGPLTWCALQVLSARNAAAGFNQRGAAPSGGGELRIGLTLCGLGLVLFAGLLSLSRGGFVALCVAALAAALLMYRAGQLSKKFAFSLGGLGALLAVGLTVYGQNAVFARLDAFATADINELDTGSGRRSLWQAVIAGIQDYPILGTGIGTHREVYPTYFSAPLDWNVEFTHAENGYLQVALEAGGAGLGLMLLGLLICAWWCLPSLRSGNGRVLACSAAVAAGLAANAAHSLTDFVWYIPGCMAIVVLLAACACRLWQLNQAQLGYAASVWRLPRPVWLLAAAGAAALMVRFAPPAVAAAAAEPHWNNYVRHVIDKPGDEDDEERASPTEQIAALKKVLRAEPAHGRAHLRLARMYLVQFLSKQIGSENAMTVEQLRDAAVASEFPSRAELDAWLERAVGEHRRYLDLARKHARRALVHCPLQGDAYLYLARLAFLEGGGQETTQAYLDQALLVRPHEGRILFALGQEAFLQDETEQALGYWKKSWNCTWNDRLRLIDMLVGRIPLEYFIEQFQPDAQALEMLVSNCRNRDHAEDLAVALERYGRALEQRVPTLSGEAAALEWVKAFRCWDELRREKPALAAANRAVDADGDCYDARYALGTWHYQRKHYAAAVEHLQWCRRRRPDDEQVEEMSQLAQAAGDGRRRL